MSAAQNAASEIHHLGTIVLWVGSAIAFLLIWVVGTLWDIKEELRKRRGGERGD